MSIPFIFGCLASSAVVSVPLAVTLVRANSRVRSLQHQLASASASRLENDSRRSEMDTVKDEFISTVSHELRTPLTSIHGALGLLSAGLIGKLDDKSHNLLRIATSNTDRLIRLINDILDLERMKSGRDPLQIRRTSLRELANLAIDSMASIADSANVSLQLVPSAPPEAVFFNGDPDRLLQVLTNLLSNAIKFSNPGGIVEVHIGADHDSVLLRVSDAGRGIPLDKLETIFDRFQQVEAADARKKGGTGLGLAICRTIIDQHSGSIWAEANPQHQRGPGASFLVSLPRVSRSYDVAETAPAIAAATPQTRSGSIILCDDDPGVRTVIAENLRRHGYRIVEAASGEEAIEHARQGDAEAILLDLYMPGLTGWETLKQLRQSPATSGIPVVILSVLSPAEISPGHLQATSAAQGWVRKPFNDHLLLAELSRVLHTGEGKPKVLLIDDDVDLASRIIVGLAEANVQIDHASTRTAAMEHCLNAPPDLLVLDLTLPDGEGFSFVAWLRQQKALATLPLVVYSGRDIRKEDTLPANPKQFLNKAPVPPSEVEALVLSIVRHMHYTGSSNPGLH